MIKIRDGGNVGLGPGERLGRAAGGSELASSPGRGRLGLGQT